MFYPSVENLKMLYPSLSRIKVKGWMWNSDFNLSNALILYREVGPFWFVSDIRSEVTSCKSCK